MLPTLREMEERETGPDARTGDSNRSAMSVPALCMMLESKAETEVFSAVY